MSRQIAVRIPDELVEYMDELVRSGEERSRAAVVIRAIERERRTRLAERDIEILKRTGGHSELDDLAAYSGRLPLTDLD